MLVSVKMMHGEVLTLEMREEENTGAIYCEQVKRKLTETLQTVGLATYDLQLWYMDDEELIDDADSIDPSRSIALFIDSPVAEFIERHSVKVSQQVVTMDLTSPSIDETDMDVLRDVIWYFSGKKFQIHVHSSQVLHEIANRDMMTGHCEMGGSYILGEFCFLIHPATDLTDVVSRGDLQRLFFSLPPNHSRSQIKFEVDAGIFGTAAYTTDDFLKELYPNDQ